MGTIDEGEKALRRYLAQHPSSATAVEEARRKAKSKGYDVGFELLEQHKRNDYWAYLYIVVDEHTDRAALIEARFSDTSESIARNTGIVPLDWIEEWLYKHVAGGINRHDFNRYEEIVRTFPRTARTPSE